MDIDKIMQLIDKVDASGISSLTVEEGCLKISIEKAKGQATVTEGFQTVDVPVSSALATGCPPQTAAVRSAAGSFETPASAGMQETSPVLEYNQTSEAAQVLEADTVYITSPIVGVFYSAPSPDAQDFVKPGDTVTKGQVVGIIEAMKLMNDIESDVDGVIEEILVENAGSVEYGQPLFTVKQKLK